MTQLAAAVDDNDELWTLDALPTPEAPYVEVEDELVEVRSRFPSSYYTLTGETLPPRIRVRRGIAGTTAASHIQGSTLTPNYGLGGGAGAAGVTVVGTTTGDVTTLIAPGATIAGDEADLSGVLVFRRLDAVYDATEDADINHALDIDIPSGAVVIKLFAVSTTDPSDAVEGAFLRVGLADPADLAGSMVSLVEYNLYLGLQSPRPLVWMESEQHPIDAPRMGSALSAELRDDAVGAVSHHLFTDGLFRVTAIIAVPA